jgi:hypothetical protein
MRQVLQAKLGVCFARRCLVVVSGTLWTARLQGSPPIAAQAGAGPLPAGERHEPLRRTAAWSRARGRTVVIFCRQNRRLAQRQSGFKCSPRLTGRIPGEEIDSSDAYLHQRRLPPTMMLGSVTTRPLEAGSSPVCA